MALMVPWESPFAIRHSSLGAAARKRSLCIAAACALACVWVQSPVALAQHATQVGGGHTEGGRPAAGGRASGGPVNPPHVIPPRAAIPPAAHPTFSRPPVTFVQGPGIGPRPAGFGPRPIFSRHRIFLRAPFFRFAWSLYPGWWLDCGSAWVWGFGCADWRPPEYLVENYVVQPPLIYQYPVYLPYGGDHEFVQLFLKDGTVFSVTDYWFVNDQVHFTTLEEDGTKSVEEVIGLDELDLQKTIEVNTRRGFRVVRRDEPLEQYLRDHPDANAPLLEAPPKN